MIKRSKTYAMIDLHGLSPMDAEHAINYWLSTSARQGMEQIRFVTGRGNHLNSKGERGTLYKNFVNWIEKSSYYDRVECCKQHDGYFEVTLKPIQKQHTMTDFFKTTPKQVIISNLEMIKIQAENGKVYFQMLYATILESGKELKQDFKQAAKFYRLAAEKNYPAAIHELARCYLHGIGVRQSDEDAFLWLQKADKLNYLESTVSVGDCYWRGQGVKQDGQIAVSYYAKAAAHRHPLAMRKLASAYNQGVGVEHNLESAFSWYKKAADLGDVIAQYNVGSMYQNGIGTKPNATEACRYWHLAAEGGDPDAQFFLGHSYLQGEGIEIDQKKALFWLERAAENGSSQANHLLSELGGLNSKENYLKRSAQSGNILDKLLVNSTEKLNEKERKTFLNKSLRESFHLHQNDIILLERDSKFLLIDFMLLEGKTHIKHKALSAIECMAEQNCIFSLRRLARFYSFGFAELKIKKNPERAIEYLQNAITLGDSKSMVSLGIIYEEGLGVLRSLEMALAFYQDGARHHNPAACCKVANFYMEGILGQPDLQQAYAYFEQAIYYEKQEGLMKHLNSGPLDDYQPLGDTAALFLKELSNSIEAIHVEAIPALEEVSSEKTENNLSEEDRPEYQWPCRVM